MKKSIFFAAAAAAIALVACTKTPTLEVDATSIDEEVSYEGATYTINVTSENGSWTAVSNEDWVTVDPATGEGAKTVRIIVAANDVKEARTALVTIAVSNLVIPIEINQAAHPKDVVDDVTFTPSDKISWTVNGEGKYYTGVVLKSTLDGYATSMNDGDLNLTIVQICSGMLAGDVLTVECPGEASFAGSTVTWCMGYFGGDAIKAGATYTVFAIPVDVADNNDKTKFDQIVTVDITTK